MWYEFVHCLYSSYIVDAVRALQMSMFLINYLSASFCDYKNHINIRYRTGSVLGSCVVILEERESHENSCSHVSVSTYTVNKICF